MKNKTPHAEGTKAPSKAPPGHTSPATHADCSHTASSVNQKTPAGNSGKGGSY